MTVLIQNQTFTGNQTGFKYKFANMFNCSISKDIQII